MLEWHSVKVSVHHRRVWGFKSTAVHLALSSIYTNTIGPYSWEGSQAGSLIFVTVLYVLLRAGAAPVSRKCWVPDAGSTSGVPTLF